MSDIQDQIGDALGDAFSDVGNAIQGALGQFEQITAKTKIYKHKQYLKLPKLKKQNLYKQLSNKKDSAGDLLNGDAACEVAKAGLETAQK